MRTPTSAGSTLYLPCSKPASNTHTSLRSPKPLPPVPALSHHVLLVAARDPAVGVREADVVAHLLEQHLHVHLGGARARRAEAEGGRARGREACKGKAGRRGAWAASGWVRRCRAAAWGWPCRGPTPPQHARPTEGLNWLIHVEQLLSQPMDARPGHPQFCMLGTKSTARARTDKGAGGRGVGFSGRARSGEPCALKVDWGCKDWVHVEKRRDTAELDIALKPMDAIAAHPAACSRCGWPGPASAARAARGAAT
jgi:hypothetical protein